MRANDVIDSANRLLTRAEEVKALQYGEFTLTSGSKSNFYFDGRLLSTDPECVHIISEVLLTLITKHDIKAFGGPAVGAVPIVGGMMLAAHLSRTTITGFFVRSEAKAHGMGKQIEGHLQTGYKAAVFDDTISTGGSIVSAIQAVQDKGARVELVACILDRQQPSSNRLAELGIPVFNLLKVDNSHQVTVDDETITKWFTDD